MQHEIQISGIFNVNPGAGTKGNIIDHCTGLLQQQLHPAVATIGAGDQLQVVILIAGTKENAHRTIICQRRRLERSL